MFLGLVTSAPIEISLVEVLLRQPCSETAYFVANYSYGPLIGAYGR